MLRQRGGLPREPRRRRLAERRARRERRDDHRPSICRRLCSRAAAVECSRRLLPTHPFVREAMQHAWSRAADLTK